MDVVEGHQDLERSCSEGLEDQPGALHQYLLAVTLRQSLISPCALGSPFICHWQGQATLAVKSAIPLSCVTSLEPYMC